jgi:hypothetical protein
MPPRTRKSTTTKPEPELRVCKTADCTKTATTRGLCDGHWMSRRGDADPKGD